MVKTGWYKWSHRVVSGEDHELGLGDRRDSDDPSFHNASTCRSLDRDGDGGGTGGEGQVHLCVGGRTFVTTHETLVHRSAYFQALLAHNHRSSAGGDPLQAKARDAPVFVDRDGTHFDLVLAFLRDGVLVEENLVVLRRLRMEAEFYGLQDLTELIDGTLPRETHMFAHLCDGDRNGLFYYLGSRGRAQRWANPVRAGTVDMYLQDLKVKEVDGARVFVGDRLRCDWPEMVVEGQLLERGVLNRAGMCSAAALAQIVDLRQARVRVEAYTLRASALCGGMAYWQLSGCNGDPEQEADWQDLHAVEGNSRLGPINATHPYKGFQLPESGGEGGGGAMTSAFNKEMAECLGHLTQSFVLLNVCASPEEKRSRNQFYRYLRISPHRKLAAAQRPHACQHAYHFEVYGEVTGLPLWEGGTEPEQHDMSSVRSMGSTQPSRQVSVHSELASFSFNSYARQLLPNHLAVHSL